jgi:hypothetical protein
MDSCEMYRARWPSKTGRYSTTVAAKFGTRACDNFTPRVFFPEFSGEKADDRILKIQKKRHVGKGKVKTRRCIMNSSINFDRINLLLVHILSLFVSLVYCAESTVRWFVVREKHCWMAADSADKSKRIERLIISL